MNTILIHSIAFTLFILLNTCPGRAESAGLPAGETTTNSPTARKFTAKDLMEMAESFDTSTPERQKLAIRLFWQAANEGHQDAIRWLQKAADKNHADAQVALGYCYAFGQGVAKDEKTAFEWYKKAAEQGDMQGQFRLGRSYLEGSGVETNREVGISWIRKAADKNYADAQVALGMECFDAASREYWRAYRQILSDPKGFGKEPKQTEEEKKNRKEAMYWFLKAAEQNHPFAQYGLAVEYSHNKTDEDSKNAAIWYTKAAKNGLPEAQYELGQLYEDGKGVAKDLTQAADWYCKAAERGHQKSQYQLGLLYTDWKSVPKSWIGFGEWRYADGNCLAKDPKQAAAWYRKAAEQGYKDAQGKLGLCYSMGEGVEQNSKEAIKWFEQADMKGLAADEEVKTHIAEAENGSPELQTKVGGIYERGYVVKRDYAEALRWNRKAAEKGYAEAQLLVGNSYARGEGVQKDLKEAVKWYRRAAEQGNEGAQSKLGQCYAEGEGVAQDSKEAIKWFDKAGDHERLFCETAKLDRAAAENGDVKAMCRLGLYFQHGVGVAFNPSESFKWYLKAAEKGDSLAQRMTGGFYETGFGVGTNQTEATRWIRKAADQGETTAQNYLGYIYTIGKGVDKDPVVGVSWYRQAAQQGDAEGQARIGSCYLAGTGVAKNYVEAYKWFSLSAAQGSKDGQGGLKVIEKIMTAEQIALAQQEAANFTPRTRSKDSAALVPKDIGSESPSQTATGFVITKDGYLITNHHVVDKVAQIRVLATAGMKVAKLVKVDAGNDLAVLKIEGKFSPVPITSSRSVKLGESVVTVGFPNIGLQGFSPKVATGEIASLAGVQDDSRHFQISTPVQPGNSGGALVDMRGNVIGVVVGKLSQKAALATSGALAENVNYAIKSSFLLGFLESLPEISAKLAEPKTKKQSMEDIVEFTEQATVLVLVY